jgi:hypothetical protein
MKKVTLSIVLITLTVFAGKAQSNFEKAMLPIVADIHKNSQQMPLQPLANKMERIASVVKEEWLPNYWLAYCYSHDSFMKQEVGEKDQLLEMAEVALAKSEAISEQENAEIAILKAQIASARMSIDPMNRYQKYRAIFGKGLKDATNFDPNNPRIYYLQGTSAFFTPENFGGGQAVAKPLFEKALEKFDTFELKNDMYPAWGLAETNYFLSQCK